MPEGERWRVSDLGALGEIAGSRRLPERAPELAWVVALPVPAPTDLGFGDYGGHQLFVTKARDTFERESLDTAPLSGQPLAVVDAGGGVLPRMPS